MTQASALESVLYIMHIIDIPELIHNTIAKLGDDTPILAVGKNHEEAIRNLLPSVNEVKSSVHINFTNKRDQYPYQYK